MDLIDVLLQVGLLTVGVVFYLIFIRKSVKKKGFYQQAGWNYYLKKILAWYAVKRWKVQLPTKEPIETPQRNKTEGWDDISIRASAPDGSVILLGIRKLCRRKPIAEATVHIKLPDGTSYTLLQHPQTAVSEWMQRVSGEWSAGGLKIQVNEHMQSLRIIFNGLLKCSQEDKAQHVKFNLLWKSATSVVQHPNDWSDNLAAETLALEPWRDGNWWKLLNNCGKGSGSWMQWGVVQGRFQSFNADGIIERNEYLRVRGVRERSWAPGYKEVRRTVTITAIARDGTAVQIRGFSYYKHFTQCISGSVRFPNYMVKPITSTDFSMSDFCENPQGIPKTYTINISTLNNRTLKVVLRVNKDEGRLLSGPDQQEIVYRTINVSIDDEHGTGILELGYENIAGNSMVDITSLPVLKWLSEEEAGDVGYCVSFEERAAFCTSHVGGKGASLALLASVQTEQGYCVPPGFCVTTKAFNKHLDINSNLRKAIKEIESNNDKYDEIKFKEKCEKAYSLFISTPIVEDVKDSVMTHLSELKKKTVNLNLGGQLRFAVRSSAVGEDSEALSAAGQNETVLGVLEDDVLHAVQKCWASMFSFTSAYYRRQNGQACLCSGGVVVQALVAPRVAGVLFTTHPQCGDPTRLLLTANYGLGESVVSGSVEPDTIIVRRETDGTLSIAQILLGSKNHKIITADNGVKIENVSSLEKNIPCLSETEIFKLARLGISQQKLWGAGRDIEWAIHNDDIFLLQARPITSLERWTEEELLHELDFPIMSDDELITFANTGEVLPKPLTALTYDVVYKPLERGVGTLIETNGDGYDKNVVITHNRCCLASYNALYRRFPKEIDVNIRMLEMAVHGHKVADEMVVKTALHRRQPKFKDKIFTIFDMLKSLITSKWVMDETIKNVNIMNLNVQTEDPMVLLDVITGVHNNMFQYMRNHGSTSVASTFTQFIAMTVLLEGRSDFTPEECNEISTLLSSGDVLSAEVPHALANFVRKLEILGKLNEFREQNPNYALQWLKNNVPRVYNDVLEFLDQHGHRAIMEFDLSTKPWSLVPEELMKVLQHMRPTKEEQRQKSLDEIIASLKTPQKLSTRRVLRWVVPLCWRAVRHREATKAHMILAVHKLRLAAARLGQQLTRAWLLPSADLVYHFRAHELREYIATRDPVLLKKAIQRQQFYSGWCKLKFAEIIKGWPEPLKVEGSKFTAGELKLKATSVCGGDVIARACVIKNLSEINELQHGDILITHSTDIGWSPYFPLLSGIVTELGGLISHGAVIAREYGLPCIVGATHATELFKTGETIRLSGYEGIVEKVSISQEDKKMN
ncbi:unnamed protein product [Euphydryas editha]|uniref:Phosphoenolpyruvate synthase n=1 Tax=Euphydryas editha TaxID=104508 RepID=A0AAU9UUF0_EUPED|nr:unnamed protein product [Euphydryas editha]